MRVLEGVRVAALVHSKHKDLKAAQGGIFGGVLDVCGTERTQRRKGDGGGALSSSLPHLVALRVLANVDALAAPFVASFYGWANIERK